MKFPMDGEENNGEEDDEAQQEELILDEESFVPHATIKQKQTPSASSSALSVMSAANTERAKYLAFNLPSHYQILMVAAHDLNELVGNEDDGEEEDEDDEP